jgi:hypothetical protein
MKLHLILAVFWIVTGVMVLVLDPPQMQLRLGGTAISTGWIAFLLALYNLMRWWSYRSALAARQAAEEAAKERERAHRKAKDGEAERNPDFIFDDSPRNEGNVPPA